MWRATYTSESFHGSRAVPFDAGAFVLMTQTTHTPALGKRSSETLECSGAGSVRGSRERGDGSDVGFVAEWCYYGRSWWFLASSGALKCGEREGEDFSFDGRTPCVIHLLSSICSIHCTLDEKARRPRVRKGRHGVWYLADRYQCVQVFPTVTTRAQGKSGVEKVKVLQRSFRLGCSIFGAGYKSLSFYRFSFL